MEINDCSKISAEMKGCDERVESPENMPKKFSSCFNDDYQKEKCDMNTHKYTTEKAEVIPQSVSFQSASGKHIGISDAAGKEAAGLLAELENNSDVCVKPMSEKAKTFLDKEYGPTQKRTKDGSNQIESFAGDTIPQFVSFQSAGGKKIAISEEATIKARQLMAEVTVEHNTTGTADAKSNRDHAKQLLAPKEEFGAKQKESLAESNIPQFVSFESAGGKKIAISEKATIKARQLMAEVTMETDITKTAEAKSHRDDDSGNLKGHTKVCDGFKPFKAPKPASSTNNKNCEQSLQNNFTDTVDKPCEATRESGRDEFSNSLDGLTSTQMAEVFLETDDDIAWTQIQSRRSIENDTSDGEIQEEPRPTELFGSISSLLQGKNVVDEPRVPREPREQVSPNTEKVETEGGGKPEKDQTENGLNSSVVISRNDIGSENDSQWDPLEVNDSLIRLTDDPTRSDIGNQEKIEDIEEEIGLQLDPKLDGGMEESRNGDANSLLNTSVKSPSFVTASGYAIMIQDESYGAAKQLFSDINDDRECGEPIPLSPEVPGVWNTVKTCENELAIKEYEENKIEKEELSKSKSDESTPGKPLEVGFCGFQTAGGQKVSVSEESLKKIQSDQTLGYSSETSLNAVQPQIYDGHEIIGFQTARGEKVNPSKEALAKVKGIFEELPGERDVSGYSRKTGDEREHFVDAGRSNTKSPSFVGCETVAEQKSGISGINPGKVSEKDTNILLEDTQKPEIDFANKEFRGFSTASGRKVSVSEEALKRVEGMLSMAENEGCSVSRKTVNVPSVPFVMNKAVAFTGFQTAGGSKVTVAQENLEKTKNLLREVSPFDENKKASLGGKDVCFRPDDSVEKIGNVPENYAMNETIDVSRESNNVRINKGFQTASGNAVTVSKANFEKSRNLLVHDNEDITQAAPIFGGFTSGNGKEITVSDAALLRAKIMLQKYDDSAVVPVQSFTGFQTAGGSAVTVSESALQQAVKFHESVGEFEVPGLSEACQKNPSLKSDLTSTNSATFTNVSTEALKSFTGFLTGRGQKVSISEEALNKARTFIHDNDKYEDVVGDEQKETNFDIETEAKESTKV